MYTVALGHSKARGTTMTKDMGGGTTVVVMYGRSRTTKDVRVPAMPGRITPEFSPTMQASRAPSALRRGACSANRIKGELDGYFGRMDILAVFLGPLIPPAQGHSRESTVPYTRCLVASRKLLHLGKITIKII